MRLVRQRWLWPIKGTVCTCNFLESRKELKIPDLHFSFKNRLNLLMNYLLMSSYEMRYFTKARQHIKNMVKWIHRIHQRDQFSIFQGFSDEIDNSFKASL